MLRFVGYTIALFLLAVPAAAQNLSAEEVKKLALEAILENPEIIMEAVAIIQQREAEAAAASSAEVLSAQRDTLENDPNAPVLGNPDGDVTLVEFFDYNCPYCRRAGAEVKAILAEDPDLRVVFREWPILGEGSVLATRAALASRAQGKYEAFHWALMALEGRIDERSVMETAQTVGLDLERLKTDMEAADVDAHIATSLDIARKLGFNGTPSFVIGDVTVPGFVDRSQLIELIAEARDAG